MQGIACMAYGLKVSRRAYVAAIAERIVSQELAC